jgi:hypothetical protein
MYPLDIIYLKVSDKKGIISIPFVEAVAILTNVTFDFKASVAKSVEAAEIYYVIKGNTDKEKNKIFEVSKPELIKRLQLDIYDNKTKIIDMAIQPGDELQTDEVTKFIS